MPILPKTKKLKVGDILIAKNRCRMDDGELTLTKGWEYPINHMTGHDLTIIDDQGDNHFYELDSKSPLYYGRHLKIKKS